MLDFFMFLIIGDVYMSVLFIIGQILTFISYLVFWISRFLKEKNKILALDNISRIFAIIAFIFLGTYDGY